ncbi:molybdenum cofactor guanylyltransferase [Pedobacter sp. SD-b]|uniref:Molybdenum cofactor guanylyltransferase n=1 Tax=Pedobacter segetis TaxID=2793069 RepID=A0ABS1BFF7_9SPHI|nr:molybdenum cofactor guanylyltransferase [Pedobacter segetis]MBK0381586.1 molybdenum cofactor guanylyltransferase [Pedobacter segetis]
MPNKLKNNNLKGLILCGGESKRAGTDKGLKTGNGTTWVKLVANKLENLGLDYFVSINSSQIEKYKNEITEKLFILDDLDILGPLRGILSAHQKYPKNNWLILACDMIDMDLQTIRSLINEFLYTEKHDFYVYKNEEFYQPFCGIYTADGLSKLLKKYSNKELDTFKLQNVFKNHDTLAIPINLNDPSFNNYNQP